MILEPTEDGFTAKDEPDLGPLIKQPSASALSDSMYRQFKRKAHALLSNWHGQTLCTTELVSETWLRIRAQFHRIEDQAHYGRLLSRAMRQVLIDRARVRQADKRGYGSDVLSLALIDTPAPEAPIDVLTLDQAMSGLAKIDPVLAEQAELQVFAGLSVAEVATLSGVSERTAFRRWRTARTYLLSVLAET